MSAATWGGWENNAARGAKVYGKHCVEIDVAEKVRDEICRHFTVWLEMFSGRKIRKTACGRKNHIEKVLRGVR